MELIAIILLLWALIGYGWFSNRMRTMTNQNYEPTLFIRFLGGPIIWALRAYISFSNRKIK